MISSRPEKSEAMERLVYAVREAMVAPARDGDLNLAEVCLVLANVLASVLVGAYDQKNREIVLSAFPDVVRTSFPQWEKIYADFLKAAP